MPSLYLNVVLFKSSVHSMFSLFGSHDLMLLISFADVIRTPAVGEVEVLVAKGRRECDALIRRLVGLSAEEVDISFV